MKGLFCALIGLLALPVSGQNWAIWYVGPNTNGLPTDFPARVEDVGTNSSWPGADMVCTNADHWRLQARDLARMGGTLPVSKLATGPAGKFLRADLTWQDPPAGGGGLPAGVIVMWSGTLAAVPSGWALCDGNNGTPDLRDRFIKGWQNGVNPGGTGGSSTYSDIINHTHTVTVNDPGHTHLTQRYPTATGTSSGFTIDTSMSGTLADNTLPTKSATTGITATTANPVGGVASITIEPPYFRLAYIMKL